ncbi:UbiH/UbiF/VisC/COQ6 family ubiquinone biosynthesis hydroxylase [Candidatus Spongiihabitans sp.]|uniref:UbiH/UbiF/VisC/COQ6 family ubiquinone biosynthesis hydroxylase n=1 Tax=Candidatus Spongiihabitans sp. TaxID=3101308 RepID=UPI003C7E76BC
MAKKSDAKSTAPRDTACDATFDVVVAGAGMVGATAACLFAKQGLRVGLLDSKSIADWQAGDARVSAINIASMNIFQALEVWQAMRDNRVSPYRAMRVWEQGSDAAISFDAQALGQPQLGFIIENSVIVSALIEKLRQNYNVSIMEGTSLSQRQIYKDKLVLVTEDNKSLECGLLVGADGAQSKVRELCGIETAGFDYQQDAIVTRVATQRRHQQTAWQSFLPTGAVAMLPLQDGRCSVVWSCDRAGGMDCADRLMDLSDAAFCAALSDLFEQHLGRVLECDERFRFPLRQHHAARYIDKYTALVGDAAHITHPLAGLGANIGLMDVAALAEVVNQARTNRQNIANHSVLRRYERWRKGENEMVLGMMKGFKTVFGHAHEPIKTARHLGLNLADRMPPLKAQFAKYAMGLSGDLPEICKG